MEESRTICGLKLTHDGGIAAVEGNRLLFCIEAEKVGNAERHTPLSRTADIARLLTANGLEVDDLDAVAIDGWSRGPDGASWVEIVDDAGATHPVDVAGYEDAPSDTPHLLTGRTGTSPLFGDRATAFRSFTHGTDHALASYCTSPFARGGQASLVLVWDGGMPPILYRYDPEQPLLESMGPVVDVSGGLYPIFATHFAPFRVDHSKRRATNPGPGMEALLPVSGKAMAYAGLDEVSEDAIDAMAEITATVLPVDGAIKSYLWSRRVLDRIKPFGLSDAAVLASFQEHLFRLLVQGLEATLAERPDLRDMPMCLSGGCALNLKWNSGLRGSGLFTDVWVPPFPNDAGSAIGAACTEMIRSTGTSALEWSVFAGPEIGPAGRPPPGWQGRPCEIEEVAKILELHGEPVVVVSGRAELGPRALGHRSIVAPATDDGMKDLLNDMKHRESYRPVAPICLEGRAPEVFAPGSRDPFMLFDHQVRPGWKDRVPAIVHADGSARLQTVGEDNALMHRLLTAYEASTGIPVLCNTSANFKGCGFFPDATSAMRWGRTRFVWSEGTLYFAEGEPERHDGGA